MSPLLLELLLPMIKLEFFGRILKVALQFLGVLEMISMIDLKLR